MFLPFLEEGHGYTLFPICLVEEKKLPEAVELLTCRSALKLPQPEAVEAASTPALKAALDSAGGHGTVALAVEAAPAPTLKAAFKSAGGQGTVALAVEEESFENCSHVIILRHKIMPHIIYNLGYTYKLLQFISVCVGLCYK